MSSDSVSTKAYDFFLVNAFSSSPFGGNPAAVLFLDKPLADESSYLKLAQNFNQPITSFIIPTDDEASEPDATTVTFRIRWFTIVKETALCGHGTIAAAHALFSRPELVAPSILTLRFKAMHGYVYARRVLIDGAPDRIEIEFPAFTAKAVEDTEFRRISTAVSKALRREVKVNFIGYSGGGEKESEVYVLIELDESEALSGVSVDTSAMVETTPYRVNILTVASKTPGFTYETRMFAPRSGVPEDHVCGSANCLMAPYWANKLGITKKDIMRVKQGSKRGGDLWVTVDTETRRIRIQGEAKLTGFGQSYL